MRHALAALLLLGALAVAAPSAVAEPAACVPTSFGLDYHSQACADPSDTKCPVYHERHTDAGIERTCVP